MIFLLFIYTSLMLTSDIICYIIYIVSIPLLYYIIKTMHKYNLLIKILISIILIPLILFIILMTYAIFLTYYNNTEIVINFKNNIYYCDKQIQKLAHNMIENNCEKGYEFKYGKRFIVNNYDYYSISKLREIENQCHFTFDSIVSHMLINQCYQYVSVEWDNKEKYKQDFNEVIKNKNKYY